ncbi:M12 family metallo-peptidase [Flavobacterium sp.]|uniref:M12 family metallo-peptidase n=1 Tax=Flavobacterium sp. TaxID=239 RepID=UPI003752FE1B
MKSQSRGEVAKIVTQKLRSNTQETIKDLLNINTQFDESLISREVSKATIFEFNKTKALDIINRKPNLIAIEIKTATKEKIILDLYKEESAFSSLTIETSDGKEFDQSKPNMSFYRGMIRGNKNSVVSLSISESEISGFISYQNGNLIIGKLKNYAQIILYNDKDLKQKIDFNCANIDGDTTTKDYEILNNQNDLARIRTSNCVRLYYETEYDIYQNLGSTASVVAYVLNLYNQVGTLFTNDGISTSLSHIFIWTIDDPYTATITSHPSSMAEVNAYRTTINGDLGQVISFRNTGGGAAGIARICNERKLGSVGSLSRGFANVPLFSNNVYLSIHEFGHSFGSQHTHACVWNGKGTAIDSCVPVSYSPVPGIPSIGGTIMSYCHTQSVGVNFSLGFGPQPLAVITNHVNSSNCLTTCCIEELFVNVNVEASGIDYKQATTSIIAKIQLIMVEMQFIMLVAI